MALRQTISLSYIPLLQSSQHLTRSCRQDLTLEHDA